ncbi:VWA domain-containing protein [Haloferula chungangensis]|uniref:VWA domain-containing protein n=1 Tax=Haloferula chungangensis TaxID=1048331 RepID=A0ABW2L8P8_9BACT
MLTFLYLWLFVLAPLPWIVKRFAPPRPRSAATLRVPFGQRLEHAISKVPLTTQVRRNWFRSVAPILVWLLVLSALARPQWIEAPIEKLVPTRDLLLLVDLSGSMQAKDFTDASGKKVDRLTAVKGILGDFLEKREGDRVGLVVFGDAPFLQAPFSTDLSLSRKLLDETAVGMAGPRTALGDAIGLGINLFDSSDAPAKTIIALTDGNDTKSQVPPIEAARVAAERKIRIHTVAIGDPRSVGEEKLDQQALDQVAEITGGRSYFAGDRDQLAGIYNELDKIETREIKKLSYRPRHDVFFIPLLLALALSLAGTIRLRRAPDAAPTQAPLLHVNPVTGELEVTS